MGYHLGVDLGTTYTAAAVSRHGQAEPVTLGTSSVAVPSVVYLDDQFVIGQPAVRRAITEPSRVAREFKRRVGDPTPMILDGTPIPAEMLMARVLTWVVEQVTSTEGAEPDSISLCHPANWGTYKLDLLGQAIRHLGVQVDHLIPEPVAAATFYASQRELAADALVAVYDLGGGTFDASLVQGGPDGFRILGQPDGLERLGGIDFDYAVLRHVTAAVGIDPDHIDSGDDVMAAAMSQLRIACMDAKEALSSDTDVSIPVMLPMLHTEVRLTRTELEAMVRPALLETLSALRRTIASADVAPEDLQAVLLVGGSSRIPLVSQLVMAELGRPVTVDARPKDTIPMGAALAAAASTSAPVASPTAPAAESPSDDDAPLPTPPAAPAPEGEPIEYRGRRPSWWWAAAAAVVLAGVAGLLLLLNQPGESPSATISENTTTSTPSDSTDSNTTMDPGTETAVTSDGGQGEGLEPLPGEDWGDSAQSEFVQECTTNEIGSSAGAFGLDPDDLCGCMYDEVATSGLGLEEFNEAWTAVDVDPSHPGTQALESAVFSCSGAAGSL